MPIFSAPAVGSVFSRTGNIIAASGDYTAAQVTNAADKSSGSLQSFVSEILSPALEASGIGGLGVIRLVGSGTAAPTSGTWLTGDVVVDFINKQFYACATGGTPGTWVTLGGASALTNFSGTLAANVSLGAGVQQVLMTTPSLALGTYLVTVTITASVALVADPFTALLAQGTAVATFSGPTGLSGDNLTAGETGSATCVATVTTAGTLTITGIGGASAGCTFYALDDNGFRAATGYTILKIG